MSRLLIISSLLLLIYNKAVGQQPDYDSLYLLKNCVTLDAKESVDEDRDDLIYKWQFGDGGEGSGQVVEHCYDSLGTYDVTLAIIDPSVVSLFQDEWNFEVTIKEDYLISFGTKQKGLTVTCRSSLSYDEKPADVVYFWDYGDGKFQIGDEVSHTYDSAGTYTIRVLAQVTEDVEVIQLSTAKNVKIN